MSERATTKPKSGASIAPELEMLDRGLLVVDRATYDKFVEILARPASGEGFERLMRVRAPNL